MESHGDQQAKMEQLIEIHHAMTAGVANPVAVEAMVQHSKELSEETELYKHSEYQATVAAIAASHVDPFVIVVAPTSSGKTWMQGLLARHYCLQGKRVTIVEPNETLRVQTAEKLGVVHYHVTITTVERLYQEGPWGDVIILDEYDSVVDQWPYYVSAGGMSGIWQFRGRKVVAFSATSSAAFERLIANTIGAPKVLRFKSEYELVKGVSAIQEAVIKHCRDDRALLDAVTADIELAYDGRPVVVVHEEEQLKDLEELCKHHKWRHLAGTSPQVLASIRQWSYGVLLLHANDGRGVDARFAKDALVLIVAKVSSHHELQQMIGRSSRTRGVCEGVLFVVSEESAVQIIDRLKRQNVAALQDLERLVNVLAQRTKDHAIRQHLTVGMGRGKPIRSLNELQGVMEPSAYAKLQKTLQP